MVDDPTVDEPEEVNAYAVTARDGYTFYIAIKDLNVGQVQWDAFLGYMRGDTDA